MVICRIAIVITHIRELITLLVTTHQPVTSTRFFQVSCHLQDRHARLAAVLLLWLPALWLRVRV